MAYDALNADQRAGATLNGKPSYTIDQAAAQLTRTGLSWSATLGTPTTVTYAYRATAPAAMPLDTAGFQQFSGQQIMAAEAALKLWAEVANITFVRVTDPGSDYSNNATILFGDYTSGEDGASSFAYMPGNRSAASVTGDVWVNASLSENRYVVNQYDDGFTALVHEMGHAIGLSHPSNYDVVQGGADPTYAADASYAEDSIEYSLMSYFDITDTGGKASPNARAPGGPLIDDIAAAQRLYGANMATNVTDTVYGNVYGGLTGAGLPDHYLQAPGDAIWGSIWDAGGNDTLDFSGGGGSPGQINTQKLDLHAGAFSDVDGGVGNLSIAQGVTIENAIGGAGDDVIIGNDVANRLSGNGGNDRITGGPGDDTIDGGAGTDTAVYAGHARQYAVTGAGTVAVGGIEGHDTLTGIEDIAFRDATITFDADSNAARIMRLYHTVLARTPDAFGLDNWLHAMEGGLSFTTVVKDFLTSPEFTAATGVLSNADFVEYLYNHALGRASDPGGKAGWVSALDHGTLTRTDVVIGFSESPEDRGLTAATLANGLYETDAVSQQVAALYDAALGRLPDAGGLDGWVGAIKSGSLTLASTAQGFAAAPEFVQKTGALDNGQFVTYLYQNALHRAPDPGGFANWSDALAHGESRADVMLGFAESTEHLQLIAGHITNGITFG